MLTDCLEELKNTPIRWLGLMDYDDALEAQNRAAERVRLGGQPEILALHHSPVITLGKRGQALSDLLVGMDVLRDKKVKMVCTDRGGQATLHNPGQLVIYPILPLKRWDLGVRHYVECLERASAYFFAEYGIEVTRGYEPGLWVGGKKIAAFGIRVDRGVSTHGLAMNVYNDLNLFSLIRQCGKAVVATNLNDEMSQFMDSLPTWDMAQAANLWLDHFRAQLATLEESGLKDEAAVPVDVPQEMTQAALDTVEKETVENPEQSPMIVSEAIVNLEEPPVLEASKLEELVEIPMVDEVEVWTLHEPTGPIAGAAAQAAKHALDLDEKPLAPIEIEPDL